MRSRRGWEMNATKECAAQTVGEAEENKKKGERIDKSVAAAPKIVAQSSLHFIRLLEFVFVAMLADSLWSTMVHIVLYSLWVCGGRGGLATAYSSCESLCRINSLSSSIFAGESWHETKDGSTLQWLSERYPLTGPDVPTHA